MDATSESSASEVLYCQCDVLLLSLLLEPSNLQYNTKSPPIYFLLEYNSRLGPSLERAAVSLVLAFHE
jgi:hypothetical protein